MSFLRGARPYTSQICTAAVFFREWTQIIKIQMIKSEEAKVIKAGKSTHAGPGYRNSRMVKVKNWKTYMDGLSYLKGRGAFM